MLNFQAMRLLHRHDENDYIPMAEHGVDAHDPERELLRGELRGARVFRCTTCPEEVLVVPAAEGSGESPNPA